MAPLVAIPWLVDVQSQNPVEEHASELEAVSAAAEAVAPRP